MQFPERKPFKINEYLLQAIIDTDDSDDDKIIDAVNALEHAVEDFCESTTNEDVPVHRGSVPNRQYINRDHVEADKTLCKDYLDPEPVFSPKMFRRRFRMRPELFRRIVNDIVNYEQQFEQKFDSAGKAGPSPRSKVAISLRILAYGCPADSLDEYFRMGERTIVYYFRLFCKTIVSMYGGFYWRYPTEEDTRRLLNEGRKRGFPGMLGSIDCMHWEWKNCPKALHGQFKGKEKTPTLILEVVADYELWIWHAFLGLPGSLNDINVFNRSPLFSRLCNGDSPQVEFDIFENHYTQGYYLADGIYPSYATLVKTIPRPENEMESYYAVMQEGQRKDVERTFGVLQARFSILARPVKFMNEEDLGWIMKACIVLHNMIIEDERNVDGLEDVQHFDENEVDRVVPSQNASGEVRVTDFLSRYFDIRDDKVHERLKKDLMLHLWSEKAKKPVVK